MVGFRIRMLNVIWTWEWNMELNHLAHCQCQVNVISLYTPFLRPFSVFLTLKKWRLPKYLPQETHLTHAVPAMTKEIPIFNTDVVELIGSLPTGTETEIWCLGHHFFLCTNEHWALCLETVKLTCLQNGTHEKKKNNWNERSFFLSCGELKKLSVQTSFS